MENAEARWKFNPEAAFGAARTILLLITLLLALCSYSFVFQNGEIYFSRLVAPVMVDLFLGILTFNCYRNLKSHFIVIHGDSMQIPRFGLKPLRLCISKINSIERLQICGKSLSIVVGQCARAPIVIEKRIFQTNNDFEECVQFLSKFPMLNQNQETRQCMMSLASRRERRGVWSCDAFAIWLIFLYVLMAGENFEKIDEKFLPYVTLVKDVFVKQEYYRFATAFSSHYSMFHLLLNVMALSIVGRQVETIYGKARFLNIFFISSICGSIASITFSPHQAVLGASGGIFGLLTAHFYACLKFPCVLPASAVVSMRAIFLTLSAQLVFAIIIEDLDIFSHLGGAILGALYAGCVLAKGAFGNLLRPTSAELRLAVFFSFVYVSSFAYFVVYQ